LTSNSPLGIHQHNTAECAIRTFKNHFISGLNGIDKNFPLYLWDHLVPQALLTLNLLRGSCTINPKLSAWAQRNGQFGFNHTPIAPPGIRILVHEKPNNRTSWSPTPMTAGTPAPPLIRIAAILLDVCNACCAHFRHSLVFSY
jgi:hypothetical protein